MIDLNFHNYNFSIQDEFCDWQIEGKLGEGHLAAVYEAQEIAFPHRKGIIKIFFCNNEETSKNAYAREKEIVKSQPIPGDMTEFYGSGSVDGHSYLIVERFDELPDNLTLNQFVHLALDLIDNIELLANKSLYHNDIKPQNIGLKNGKARLFDFDAASRFDERMYFHFRSGTGHYMAPEVRTDGNVSLLSEFYSLGVTLRELCPKEGEYIFDKILSRATASTISQRPQTISEFRNEILKAVPEFKRKVAKDSRLKKVAIVTGIILASFSVISSIVILLRNIQHKNNCQAAAATLLYTTPTLDYIYSAVAAYYTGAYDQAYRLFLIARMQSDYDPNDKTNIKAESIYADCLRRLKYITLRR